MESFRKKNLVLEKKITQKLIKNSTELQRKFLCYIYKAKKKKPTLKYDAYTRVALKKEVRELSGNGTQACRRKAMAWVYKKPK